MILKQQTRDSVLIFSLNDAPYFWFTNCGKEFEIKEYNNRWNNKKIHTGRKIKGVHRHCGNKFFTGEIGEVVTGTLDEIFNKVDFKKIIPIANFREDAIKIINDFIPVKRGKKYIAFEIIKLIKIIK